MPRPKNILKLGAVGLVVVVLGLVAAACSSGISKEQYDTVQQQLAAEQQKAAALQQQISTKDKAVSDAQALAAAKDKELADLKKTGVSAGMTPLIYAKAVGTPTPRPTATPLPAGAPTPTAAPAVKPPAEFLTEKVPFVIYVETLGTSSISKFGEATYGPGDWSLCNPASIFSRGSKLVWRYEIYDMSTGLRLTGEDGTVTKIVLPHGEEITARFSRRAGVGPWTWAAGWDIPLDYPMGALDWSIKVSTKDGRNYTWKVPAVVKAGTATSRPEDSRVQIVERIVK